MTAHVGLAGPGTTASAAPANRNLVFTSAGDRASLDRWLVGRRNFDLFVCYYGDETDRYRDVADRWWARKGSRFVNFHHLWRSEPGLLAPYDAVMVLDDDILIDGDSLSRLFDLREQHHLTVLQPSFSESSKLSHPITARREGYAMRFTEFVEMNCPLFRRTSLESFLAEYDPEVIGYGIDYWYMNVLYREPDFRCAIVDDVPCVNPHEQTKGGVREIDRLQSEDERRTRWETVQRARGIADVDTARVLGWIKLPLHRRIGARMRRLFSSRP